jgi:catechol 2,3-dioxygenase-like lactoylglutathione lyase family enzyme
VTSDPLEGLRLAIVPIEPRPDFAYALLRRLQDREQPIAAPSATPTVRYFVTDLETSVAFYSRLLDFEVELRPSPMFAMLYRGDLRLLLSVPGAAHALPDGTLPEPGGWNRMALEVHDLSAAVEALRAQNARFRTEIVTGVGVRQVLLEDPSGNLVELFEPMAGYHERPRDPAR